MEASPFCNIYIMTCSRRSRCLLMIRRKIIVERMELAISASGSA